MILSVVHEGQLEAPCWPLDKPWPMPVGKTIEGSTKQVKTELNRTGKWGLPGDDEALLLQ